MTAINPGKEWWTAQEIADAGLPDLPASMQGAADLAKRNGWRAQPAFARRRAGRGGGWEYHWRLFPARAQRELLKRANAPVMPEAKQDRAEAWSWFDGLPDSVKGKAQRTLRILQEVEALAPVATKFMAVGMIAKQHHVSDRTIWNWFSRVEGVDPADWLPYLAPRHRATEPKAMKVEAAPQFFAWLKADYLRLEGTGFTSSWRRAVTLCKAHKLDFLEERTARRWIDKNVPRIQQVFLREGVRGLMKCYPPQIRDRSGMTALEGVNADCHKIDVFVWWPGVSTPIRPQIVAFQDLYSGKILSYRVDTDPNKVAVMSAFMELLRLWGIPQHCLFDNGMEFANKWLSGGARKRFRFKLREGGEPLGVLAMLGVQVHFATPAHGQAKPIERAFGDFARDIAKDPRFAGAYVGHKPDAKPENYASRAIDLAEFLRVLEEGVAEHNARVGRRSDVAAGRSFDETFAESYSRVPIRKATEEQLRLCLMAQQVCTLNQSNGQITLHKNKYWSEWMSEIAGQTVVARFNPEDLHEGAQIYSLDGEYLGYAACRYKSKFFDLASARAAARDRARYLSEQRKAARKTLAISVKDLASDLDKITPPPAARPEATVVKLDHLAQIEQRRRNGGLIRPALPTPDTSRDADLAVLQFPQPRQEPKQDPEVARFWRVLDIERRMTAGEPIPAADAEFWGRMKDHPVYLAQRDLYDRHGAAAIG